MALTFDTTIGGTAATSYATLATADDFVALNKHETDWSGLTNAQKQNLLMRATLILDDNMAWHGNMTDSKNALQWPRLGVFDKSGTEISSDTIPTWLKYATAELARMLNKEDRDLDPDTKGFSSLSVRSLSMSIDKSDRRHVLPESVIRMISFFGRVKRATGTVQLGRT